MGSFFSIYMKSNTFMVSCLLSFKRNPKQGLLLKKRICSLGSKFFPLKVESHWEEEQNENGRSAFPGSVPTYLNMGKKIMCISGLPWQFQPMVLCRIWGGAMKLGKLPVPGHPTNLDNSRARPCCSFSRWGWRLFGHFFSHLSSLLLSPSLWETAWYRLKYCLKGPLNPRQPINQIMQNKQKLSLIILKYSLLSRALSIKVCYLLVESDAHNVHCPLCNY